MYYWSDELDLCPVKIKVCFEWGQNLSFLVINSSIIILYATSKPLLAWTKPIIFYKSNHFMFKRSEINY